MAKNNSPLPRKIASTALWLLAVPVIVIVTAVRGKKEPNIKK